MDEQRTVSRPGWPADLGRRILEAGFGRPRGVLGRVGGRLMARGNAATEQYMVQLAEPGEHEAVLVLGFGPGVGLRAAGIRSDHVIGVDPSPVMREAARRRCADLIERERVRITSGTADGTGLADATVGLVLGANNVQLWPDWHAGLAELRRVLRPGGRLLLSAHRKWLPGGPSALATAVEHVGYEQIQTWDWEPPGRGATTAALLSAYRDGGPGP